MKCAIIGDRTFEDYELLKKIIKKSKFKITEIVSGGAKGVDTLAERYAEENNIPIKIFEANWKDLNQPGAEIRERMNKWTGKMEKYVFNAGFLRNTDIINYAECVIAIPSLTTSGTKDGIEKAKKQNKPMYIHEQKVKQKSDEEYEYHF